MPISLTADLSRDYNKWLAKWLWPYISARIDPGQYGGSKGRNITQYLILLFHFILSKTDRPDKYPTAVLTALIDFSKGFNRINHTLALTRLSDWNVPGWLLRIVSSYLTERSCVVRYKGAQSNPHPSLVGHLRVMKLDRSSSWWLLVMRGWTSHHTPPLPPPW